MPMPLSVRSISAFHCEPSAPPLDLNFEFFCKTAVSGDNASDFATLALHAQNGDVYSKVPVDGEPDWGTYLAAHGHEPSTPSINNGNARAISLRNRFELLIDKLPRSMVKPGQWLSTAITHGNIDAINALVDLRAHSRPPFMRDDVVARLTTLELQAAPSPSRRVECCLSNDPYVDAFVAWSASCPFGARHALKDLLVHGTDRNAFVGAAKLLMAGVLRSPFESDRARRTLPESMRDISIELSPQRSGTADFIPLDERIAYWSACDRGACEPSAPYIAEFDNALPLAEILDSPRIPPLSPLNARPHDDLLADASMHGTPAVAVLTEADIPDFSFSAGREVLTNAQAHMRTPVLFGAQVGYATPPVFVPWSRE